MAFHHIAGTTYGCPSLLKRNEHGRLNVWTVSYDDATHVLSMTTGLVGGKVRTTTNAIKTNASGRSHLDQARVEAEKRYVDKFREGYRETEAELDGAVSKAPMLAETWTPAMADAIAATFPLFIQCKLDGIRCLAFRDSPQGPITYVSRKGLEQPHFPAAFDAALGPVLDAMPDGTVLDGEMYIHGKSLQTINSIVTNKRKVHPDFPLLVFHVFDYANAKREPYSERLAALRTVLSANAHPKLALVDASLVHNAADVATYTERVVADGYEGAMLRTPTSAYEHTRTMNLIKVKLFDENEAEILGVADAEGTEKGAALLVLRGPNGQPITVRPSFEFSERARWLADPSLVVGRQATVRFNGRTDDGNMKFPRVVNIRSDEH